MADQVTDDTGELREAVRARYAAAANSLTDPGVDTTDGSCCGPSSTGSDCCGSEAAVITPEQADSFGAALYDQDADELPDTARLASLGCGNPTAVAELHEGETVLDLGSGGGIDVLLSARRVGETGKAYGLDITDEMLALARANQAKAGVENVEWLRGEIEAIPLGCIAGALSAREFEDALIAAGLTDIEIVETHRVHDKASSAIVRATKPSTATEGQP